MADLAEIPGLEGLFGLARREGVDIRATLLRVLTDLYVQTPAHPIDEERQYTVQTMRLLGSADIPTRAALARRLAGYPQTPRTVIERLARDVIEVAEPVLKHSPCLTPADLEAIARECGDEHAAMIARRGETTVSEEEASTAAAELCELFYAADSYERRLILLNLDYASAPARTLPAKPEWADIWRLENAALAHNTAQVVREFEHALGVSNAQARRMVDDQQGEPMVAAAKAMNLPAEVLQRVLLFINPVVSQSVDRVYELAMLHSEISATAALRLVAILRDADPVVHRTAPPERPSRPQEADAARRGLPANAGTQTSRRDGPFVQRSGRASRGE